MNKLKSLLATSDFKGIFLLLGIFLIYNNNLNAQSIVVKPYLQNATTTSMTIMWETDVIGTGGVIYGISPFSMVLSIASTSFNSNSAKYIHTAIVPNLTPKTKYYYKAFSQSGTMSSLYSFITPALHNDESDLNFVAMSDIQRDSGNPNVYENMINNGIIPVADSTVVGGYKSLSALIVPGDLVQDGGAYNTWKTDFFDLGDSLTPYVPMYPVLGNHEYYNGGFPNFIKYFTLPLNGTAANPEEWWYKDLSNVRIIGLNSNSPTVDLNTQLIWLEGVLNDAAIQPHIDFVFAQFHHPFKSELWTPGELTFSGNFINKLETFTTTTGKPSLHCFGHTHAYSRGTSRDHNHLWIDVAVAGGAIDNWGEFPNRDYEEFSISEDEYGFVLLQTEAGLNPKIRIRRFSRGDQITSENNTLSDELVIKRFERAPTAPTGIYPNLTTIDAICVTLKADDFVDGFDTHQASHWQVATNCTFSGNAVINLWRQSTNWYNEVNSQANDDLTDQTVTGLLPATNYCWRVRYRDQYNVWSDWSISKTFTTSAASGASNLLSNPGAENGITSWAGNIESLINNECNSVPVFAGTKFFAVGGVCVGVTSPGIATQSVDVSAYSGIIDNGTAIAEYAGYLRSYAVNNDSPEFFIECFDINNILLSTSPVLGNNTPAWLLKSGYFPIPVNTKTIKMTLRGVFIGGSDNDSYYDEMSLKVFNNICPACIGDPISSTYIDSDGDGICQSLDCNDNDAAISPDKKEVCDMKDNNCDGLVDSGDIATWSGSGGNNLWNNPANWTQNMLPLPCQHVSLLGNVNISLTGFATIKSLTIQAGSSLTISTNGELQVRGQDAINNSAISILGTLTNQGKINASGATQRSIYLAGTLTNQSTAYIEVQGGTTDMLVVNGAVINNFGEVRVRN